jgi:hypothetical protein
MPIHTQGTAVPKASNKFRQCTKSNVTRCAPRSVEYGLLNSVSVGVRPAVRILFPPPAGRADRVPQKQIELAKAGRNILSLNHRLDFYLETCSTMRPRTDSGRLAGPQDVGAKGHRALVPK